MNLERIRPLPHDAKRLNERGRRPASYIAFTRENPETHEVQVLLGEVFSFKKERDRVRFGLPGGGSQRWLGFRRMKRNGTAAVLPRFFIQEPHKTTAIRETREETGLQVNPSEIDLAYVIEQPNPLHRGTRLERLLQHLQKKTKPCQLSFVYVPNENLQNRETIEQFTTGGEMPQYQWMSVKEAKQAKAEKRIKISKAVLEGMQIATEWHKIHLSQNMFLENGFEYELMITQEDALRIKKEMAQEAVSA